MEWLSSSLGVFAGGFLVGASVGLIIASCYATVLVRRANLRACGLIQLQATQAAVNFARATVLLQGYEKLSRLTRRVVETAEHAETLILARAIARHLDESVSKAMGKEGSGHEQNHRD